MLSNGRSLPVGSKEVVPAIETLALKGTSRRLSPVRVFVHSFPGSLSPDTGPPSEVSLVTNEVSTSRPDCGGSGEGRASLGGGPVDEAPQDT